MEGITLPPDLAQYAAGVGLLRRTERLRRELEAPVTQADANGECAGFFSLDEIMQDADDLIDEMARLRP